MRFLFILLSASLIMAFAAAQSFNQNVENPGTITIKDPSVYSRVVVLSDVHGMFDSLKTLLRAGHLIDEQMHWTGGSTLLVVIGDSIDKGEKSVDVLDLWISLSTESEKTGGRVIHTLGNHEAEFLAHPDSDQKSAALYDELKRRNIPVSDLTDKAKPRGAFLKSEPAALAVGQWLFFHSGNFPAMSWSDFQKKASDLLKAERYDDNFLTGADSILESKDWWKIKSTRDTLENNISKEGFFGIVFGHQPKAFGVEGRIAAIDNGHLIKIDNGMAPEAGGHPGSLLVFDATEMRSDSFQQVRVILPDGSEQELRSEVLTFSSDSN